MTRTAEPNYIQYRLKTTGRHSHRPISYRGRCKKNVRGPQISTGAQGFFNLPTALKLHFNPWLGFSKFVKRIEKVQMVCVTRSIN